MDNKNISKILLLLATFSSPFAFILPTNFSIYEILLFLSFVIYILEYNSVNFPDKKLSIFLSLIFLGYSLSIINSPYPLEALKFPLQFFFILSFQFTMMYTLVETKRDIRQHVIALIISAVFIIGITLQTAYIEQWELGNRLETVFGINGLAVMSMMLFFTSIIYFRDNLDRFSSFSLGMKFWLLSVGVISTILLFISLMTLSRRIVPGLIFGLALLFGTKFLTDKNIVVFTIRFSLGIMIISCLTYILHIVGIIPDELLLRVIETFEGERGVGRPELWLNGVLTSIALFPLGTGFNNFATVSSDVLEKSLSGSPHSIIFNPLGEGGFLAGIGMLGLLIIFLSRFLNSLFQKNSDPIMMSFGVATVCFFIAHIFGTLPTLRFFWLYMILSFVAMSISQN